MIDGCNEVLHGAKPERPMANGLDLIVQPLDRSAGKAVLGPCENPIEMPAQHPHEFLEWFQPRSHGRAHPFLQVLLGPLELSVIPEQLECFFEVVSPHN